MSNNRGVLMKGSVRSQLSSLLTVLVMAVVIALPLAVSTMDMRVAHATAFTFLAKGELDCNGYSKIQKPLLPYMVCPDFAGFNGEPGEDNGHYVGHDEPTVQFQATMSSGRSSYLKSTLCQLLKRLRMRIHCGSVWCSVIRIPFHKIHALLTATQTLPLVSKAILQLLALVLSNWSSYHQVQLTLLYTAI